MENKGKVREHGITLVALVITIIILLILAGIAITGLTQTGLFEKARQAKMQPGMHKLKKMLFGEVTKIK